MLEKNDKALVLFSGGQDSATCLAWAAQHFAHVETIGFDYGQRHKIELQIRQDFLSAYKQQKPEIKDVLGKDHIIDASVIKALGETAMTADKAIEIGAEGLPSTFVPGRNILFFTLAASVAWRRGIRHLIGGMCETDYSGYPDCRDNTLKSLQVSLSLGLDTSFVIHTPLMFRDKAQTFEMAEEIGGKTLLETIIEHTHTCYKGDRTHRHAWGYGCGDCPACDLRRSGWEKYKSKQ